MWIVQVNIYYVLLLLLKQNETIDEINEHHKHKSLKWFQPSSWIIQSSARILVNGESHWHPCLAASKVINLSGILLMIDQFGLEKVYPSWWAPSIHGIASCRKLIWRSWKHHRICRNFLYDRAERPISLLSRPREINSRISVRKSEKKLFGRIRVDSTSKKTIPWPSIWLPACTTYFGHFTQIML